MFEFLNEKYSFSELFLGKSPTRFFGGGEVLLAPNGKKSNLTPDQYKLVRTKAFKDWFGDWENSPETSSKVVDESGNPLVVYHGTTHTWTEYSPERGNPDNFMGVGFYASSSKEDVEKNYKGVGKDLTSRIESLAEKIANEEIEKKKIPYQQREKREAIERKSKIIAKKELVGGKQKILEVYLSIQNPLILKEDWTGTNFNFAPTEDEDTGDWIESEDRIKIYDIIQDLILDKYSKYRLDINRVVVSLDFDDDVRANDLVRKFQENDYLLDWMCCDEKTGRPLNMNFIRDVFMRLGFDGVIDHIPYKRFHNMGIPHGTKHYIVWNSTQIKSATDNNGKFDPKNPDIRFLRGGKTSNLTTKQQKLVRTPEFKAWFGDWEHSPEKASKVVDENGEPLVVYHTYIAKKNKFKPFRKFNTIDVLGDEDFDFIQVGSHFGTKDQAEEIIHHYVRNQKESQKNYYANIKPYDYKTYECFLNIRKIKRVKDRTHWYPNRLLKDIFPKTHIGWKMEIGAKRERELFFNEIKGKVDGLIYKNEFESRDYIKDSYVIFHPEQIKLADGTNTTFDPNNPDIRFEKGGEITLQSETLHDRKEDRYSLGKSYADVVKNNEGGWNISMIESFNKGDGSRLMNEIVDDAKKEKISEIKLQTSGSEDFFKKFGFEIDENDDGYFYMLWNNPDIRFDKGGVLKKVKSFNTDEGKFSIYDTEEGGARGRMDMFTVFENENGWIVRNAFVPDSLQKMGIATKFYIKMNEQSLRTTGKPLRSTQPRTLNSGEVVHELSKDGIALWNSLVRKGYASRLGEKNYVFNKGKSAVDYADGGKTADYLKWKRKNVTYRGMKEIGVENEVYGSLGKGLYTAPSSNKTMARQYGKLYFVVNGRPKNPKKFNSINEWEIWFYNKLVYDYSKSKGKERPDKRDFMAKTTIETELIKLGYDGIEIKGREMVNFNPENIMYFRTEDELKDYFEHNVNI